MDVELASLVRAAVCDAYPDLAPELFGGGEDLAQREVQTFGVLEIEDCPPKIPGELSSRVCFKLAKLLVDRRIVEPAGFDGPTQVASTVLASFERQGGARWFSLELGGSGHLNAVPTGEAIVSWRRKIFGVDPSPLFSFGACVVRDDGDLPAIPLTVRDAALVQRARERREADLDALLARFESSPAPKRAERLMLIGALADPEIDATPFLSGLAGRQNVPWYLDRFRSDIDAFERRTEGLAQASGTRFDQPPAMLRESLELFARFRRTLVLAELHQRPERFFAHLLLLARDFYRLYNQPTIRALGVDTRGVRTLGENDRAWVACWVRALSRTIERGTAFFA